MTPAGLELAIPGSVGRCLIHWATGTSVQRANLYISAVKAVSALLNTLFHASGLAAELFFCASWCVLPGCLYLRAFGQSAPNKPTKQTSLVCLIAIFISSKAGSCVLSLEGVALCGTIP